MPLSCLCVTNSNAVTTASPIPAQGTLVYYGILNLVKCFLSIRGVDLETQMEQHGLSLPLGSVQELQISAPSSAALNIFHVFAKLLGKPLTGRESVSIKGICGHIPEIHEMAFTLKHMPSRKRSFLPLDIRFMVNPAESHLFTEVAYKKNNFPEFEVRSSTLGFAKTTSKKVASRMGALFPVSTTKEIHLRKL